MRELLEDILPWYEQGIRFALATVLDTSGSSPRGIGAQMAIGPTGEVVGSVSGGCVESAIHETALEVISSGQPQTERYGVSDDDAFAVGLTCGGTIVVFIEAVDHQNYPTFSLLAAAVRTGTPSAIATITDENTPFARHMLLSGTTFHSDLDNSDINKAVKRDLLGALAAGTNGLREYGSEGQILGSGITVFISVFAAPPNMFIFGAVDYAATVSRVGRFLGYHVTVCDARPTFTTAKRFPHAHEVVCDWPHRFLASIDVDSRTVICVLTHDPKFDVPLLEIALRTDAGYIGAMGSWRTHRDRLGRLVEHGFSEQTCSRIKSPIGLDIGGRTPEETAISIAAEIIASRTGHPGLPLSMTEAPIH